VACLSEGRRHGFLYDLLLDVALTHRSLSGLPVTVPQYRPPESCRLAVPVVARTMWVDCELYETVVRARLDAWPSWMHPLPDPLALRTRTQSWDVPAARTGQKSPGATGGRRPPP